MGLLTKRSIPNLLTIFRLLLILPFILCLMNHHFKWALSIFVVAGFTDALDGYLARRHQWTSRLGSIIDPLADKLLINISFVGLAVVGAISYWLMAIVFARDIVIVFGAIFFQVWIGRVEYYPSLISKLNTFLQILLVVLLLGSLAFVPLPALLIDALIMAVFLTTIISGISYVSTWGYRAYTQRGEHGEQ